MSIYSGPRMWIEVGFYMAPISLNTVRFPNFPTTRSSGTSRKVSRIHTTPLIRFNLMARLFRKTENNHICLTLRMDAIGP